MTCGAIHIVLTSKQVLLDRAQAIRNEALQVLGLNQGRVLDDLQTTFSCCHETTFLKRIDLPVSNFSDFKLRH